MLAVLYKDGAPQPKSTARRVVIIPSRPDFAQ